MRRVKSEPCLSPARAAESLLPRPLSRRMVVASMIDLTMPRPPPSLLEAVASAIIDPPAEKTIEEKKNTGQYHEQSNSK